MEQKSIIYKIFAGIVITIVTSLFFFPVNFTFFPSVNSKMALAGLGLIWFFIKIAEGNRAELAKDLFISSLLAISVSFAGLLSVLINNTSDMTYASYIISMWVWLGAAYFCVNTIRLFHGKATIQLVANYLIAVCVFQCVSAVLIQFTPFFSYVANTFISDFSGIASMNEIIEMKRMYGFGAALDVAGSRFASVLVMIGALLTGKEKDRPSWEVPIYIISYLFILVVGCMIGRTTIVGFVVSIVIWLSNFKLHQFVPRTLHVIRWFISIVIAFVLLAVYLYNTNPIIRKDLRFAFEGFFALVEDGYWHTNSNDRLDNMYIFPDNTKTWLIGDGYFDSPHKTNPYYVGNNPTEYYKGTDVGYCRFIFYFGIFGLLLFSAFIVVVGFFCSRNNPKYNLMFMALVAINFIVWFKVSTDVFLVFAPFLCLTKEEELATEE